MDSITIFLSQLFFENAKLKIVSIQNNKQTPFFPFIIHVPHIFTQNIQTFHFLTIQILKPLNMYFTIYKCLSKEIKFYKTNIV